MIESEFPAPDLDSDPGPPILLKRLGNAVEANLAKNKLETAGIPSFLGGENTFAGDLMHPLPYREVELYVPQSMVREALEVLDAPPTDPSELLSEPYADDPARSMSFRAFVTSIVGWLCFSIAIYGFIVAVPMFIYAIFLSARTLTASEDRSGSTIAKSVAAAVLSVSGIAAAIAVFIMLSR